MESSRRDLLRVQYDLAWSFFDYHLDRLEDADFLWEPGPLCWTMHALADGAWAPDWAQSQPDPVPVPTIAWTSWHLGWWLTGVLEHAGGRPAPDPSTVAWPGVGEPTVAWLRSLGTSWGAVLDQLDDEILDAPASFPWPAEAGRTVADTAVWVNVELMKNAAEIGTQRLLRASGSIGTSWVGEPDSQTYVEEIDGAPEESAEDPGPAESDEDAAGTVGDGSTNERSGDASAITD